LEPPRRCKDGAGGFLTRKALGLDRFGSDRERNVVLEIHFDQLNRCGSVTLLLKPMGCSPPKQTAPENSRAACRSSLATVINSIRGA